MPSSGTLANAGDYPYSTSTFGTYWKYHESSYDLPNTVICPSIWNGPTPKCIKDLYDQCESPIKQERRENMRYLYYVILINPKDDSFFTVKVIAQSETSALMEAFSLSQYKGIVKFDDLKSNCKVLMEWKKKESLEKAIETIKKAVE